MKENSPRFLWKASPPRAILEGLLFSLLIFGILLPILGDAPVLVITMTALLIAGICALVSGLRMRLTLGVDEKWKKIAAEIGLSAILPVGLLVFLAALLAATNQLDFPTRSNVDPYAAIFFISLSAPGYLAFRLTGWLLYRWDKLRRAHYVWELTNAILSVVGTVIFVGMMAALLIALGMTNSYPESYPTGRLLTQAVLWVTSLFLLSLAIGFACILLFLPLATIFSYFVARRLTGRLERLSQAASELEVGNLAARSPVEGEDEIAQLQIQFNNMAESLQDNTHQLQAERDKVAALLQSQRELTAGVSHELRNPAATIGGYIETLQQQWKTLPDETVDHNLEIMAHEMQRLRSILNDLLLLSQAEASRLELNLQPVDSLQLVRQAVHTFSALAWETRRVQVVAETPESLPPLKGDHLRVEQILANLIQNSLRHTPPGGVVIVTSYIKAERICLEVSDTGEGIQPEVLPHIWEKFFHAANGGSLSESVGLGLALVRELTELMGGKVEVESVLGQGSVFRVLLPPA